MADRLDRIESRLVDDPAAPIERWRELTATYSRIVQELDDLERHGVAFAPAARIELRVVQARRAGTRL